MPNFRIYGEVETLKALREKLLVDYAVGPVHNASNIRVNKDGDFVVDAIIVCDVSNQDGEFFNKLPENVIWEFSD